MPKIAFRNSWKLDVRHGEVTLPHAEMYTEVYEIPARAILFGNVWLPNDVEVRLPRSKLIEHYVFWVATARHWLIFGENGACGYQDAF